MIATSKRALFRRIAGGILAISTMLLLSCSTSHLNPSSPEEIYHHTWWNYYERARHRLLSGNTQGAKADLEVALGLRSGAKYGYPKDAWKARTYGVHFLESYFPNRELGICLFGEGKLNEAETYLEKSLKMSPSGRAKHYLNLVRRGKLTGAQVDPPVISVTTEASPIWTSKRDHPITGTASAPGRISSLQIGSTREFIELAEPSHRFSESVKLDSGLNTVVITAADLAGQRASEQIEIVADWAPPTLVVSRLEKDPAGILKASLVCEDNMALASIRLNGRKLKTSSAFPRRVAYRVSLTPHRVYSLELIDRAGNTCTHTLGKETFADINESRLATEQLASAAGATAVTELTFPSILPISAVATSGDRMRPSLRMGGVSASTVVFDEEFFFDGEVSDGGGLRSITINGEPMLSEADQGAVRQYFSRRLVLDEGTNLFEVAAADMSGNSTVKSFEVIRRDPEYLSDQYRLSVGVPPLRLQGQLDTGEEVKFTIEDELLREPARFNLLERDEGWDYIMREQKLSMSDLADPRVALNIGKILPAEMLLLANIIEEESGITVYARLVTTERGRVIFTEDVYSRASDDLAFQVSGLVMKLEQRFPLVSGRVVGKQGGKVVLDLGTRDGVVRGTRFVVIQTHPPKEEMEYGEVCKLGDAFVQLDVDRAQSMTGTARILPSAAADAIKEGDHVYAR